MMIDNSLPTAVALCAALCSSHPAARAGDLTPKGPCFSYDIVNSGVYGFAHAHDLLIDSGHAYIATDNGLAVLDIIPEIGMPLIASTDLFSFDHLTLTIHNGHLYTKGDEGFGIWNIEDPTDPWYIRGYRPNQGVNAVLFPDDGLMLAGSTVINVVFPYAPARDAVIDGAEQFVYDLGDLRVLDDDMVVWDFSSPLNPQPLNDAMFGQLNTDQIVVENGFVYARDGDDFTVLRLTAPASFQQLGTFSISDATDFDARGSLLTVLTSQALRFYDLSNPSSPRPLGEIDQIGDLGSPDAFEWHDGQLFVATSQGVLLALEIHTNPIGTHLTLDQALDTAVVGDLALVADNDAGLQVFDISNPARPVLLSTHATPGAAVAVDAVPGVAFVAAHQGGLDIVDITDPDHPALITNYDTGRTVRDIQIVGDLAYVLDRVNGLFILNIADPASPVLVSQTDTPALAERLTVENGIAVVAQGTYDTQIIDVADPAHPVIVSTIPPMDNPSGIMATAVHDGLLYVSDRTEGYRVYDLSNPAAPLLLATIDPDLGQFPSVLGFEFDGNLLYIANWRSGLTALYNADPLNPTIIASYPAEPDGGAADATTSYLAIEKRDSLMFVSAENGGLRLYDLTNCAGPCAADLNGDGILNFFDVSMFIVAYQNEDPLADFDHDGELTFFDVSSLLTALQAGCP